MSQKQLYERRGKENCRKKEFDPLDDYVNYFRYIVHIDLNFKVDFGSDGTIDIRLRVVAWRNHMFLEK